VIRQRFDTHEVYKCDLCSERLATERIPACVEACPTGCLTFRRDETLRSWLKEVGAAQGIVAQQMASIESQG